MDAVVVAPAPLLPRKIAPPSLLEVCLESGVTMLSLSAVSSSSKDNFRKEVSLAFLLLKLHVRACKSEKQS